VGACGGRLTTVEDVVVGGTVVDVSVVGGTVVGGAVVGGAVLGGAVVGGAVVGGSVLGGSNWITMLSIAPDPLSTTAKADPDDPTDNVATSPSPMSGIGTLAPANTISSSDS